MVLRRNTRARIVVGAVALVLACGASVSGCDDDEKDAAQTSGSGGSDSASATTSPTKQPDGPESEKDDGNTPAASGTECLTGTWLVDNKDFGALLQGAAGAAAESVNVAEPTGKALISFSGDNKYAVSYAEWTFEISKQGAKVQVVRHGTDKGTYQAGADGSLTTTETDMGSVATMTVAGNEQSASSEPSTTTGTFKCQGDTLQVTARGATSVMNRQ